MKRRERRGRRENRENNASPEEPTPGVFIISTVSLGLLGAPPQGGRRAETGREVAFFIRSVSRAIIGDN